MTTALFEQHQIASGTLHSSNLLTVYSTHGDETWYDIISMTTTYYLNNLRDLLVHSSNLLMAAHMEMKLGMHAYYIISTTTTGIFLYYILIFLGGLSPFTDVYVKMSVYYLHKCSQCHHILVSSVSCESI